jgi:hypothetical protein
MNHSRQLRKWQEESAISALHKRLSPSPVTPKLVHDDGRFRVYEAGDDTLAVYYVAGGATDTRPALAKSNIGWLPLDSRLELLAKEMTAVWPHLPGKSSQTRGRLMQQIVNLTPKGFGLGDSALWTGLVAKYDATETRVPAGQPGGGQWTAGASHTTPNIAATDKLKSLQKAATKSNPPDFDDAPPVEQLVAAVKDAPDFQEFVRMANKQTEEDEMRGLPEPVYPQPEVHAVKSLHAAWATDVASVAISASLQKAAQAEFGIQDAYDGTPSWMPNPYSGMSALFKKMARSIYDQTQEYLKANGIDEVTLTRGMKSSPLAAGDYPAQPITSAPLSSWSLDPVLAKRFMDVNEAATGLAGAVVTATFPRDRIFSVGGIGVIGSPHEQEVVVLGGPGTAHVVVAKSDDPVGISTKGALNVDEGDNANWLHAKKTTLREKVAQKIQGDKK